MSFKSSLGIVAAPLLLCMMCLLVLAGCGGSNNNTTSAGPVNNTAQVTAFVGPNGNGGFVNGIYVTVTVCQHGTTTCMPIPDVLVDTGSIGLRVIPSALGSVTPSQIMDGGSPLLECIQYGDTSYSWGPMALGDVQIAGEQALNIPIQLLGATSAPVPSNCLTMPVNPNLPNGGNEDTQATLGANGILGIGGFVDDCSSACTTVTFTSGYPYYICPGNSCTAVGVPTGEQATNPVAVFTSSDKNGVMITFPTVPATGANTLSGTINFGINTQSDNSLGSVTVYPLDQCADISPVNFNGTQYLDTACTTGTGGFGAFLDTGTNALAILDANTLSSFGISDCSSSSNGAGFYCVTGGGTVTLPPITIPGSSQNISLSIADATTLFATGHAVFNDLGADSVVGGTASTDFFDFGSPFFFGRTVFVGIAGEAVSGVSASSVPNGFVAF